MFTSNLCFIQMMTETVRTLHFNPCQLKQLIATRFNRNKVRSNKSTRSHSTSSFKSIEARVQSIKGLTNKAIIRLNEVKIMPSARQGILHHFGLSRFLIFFPSRSSLRLLNLSQRHNRLKRYLFSSATIFLHCCSLPRMTIPHQMAKNSSFKN